MFVSLSRHMYGHRFRECVISDCAREGWEIEGMAGIMSSPSNHRSLAGNGDQVLQPLSQLQHFTVNGNVASLAASRSKETPPIISSLIH